MNHYKGSETLLRQVRAALILNGETLSNWNRNNTAFTVTYVIDCLKGLRNGDKSKALRTKIVEGVDAHTLFDCETEQ